MSADPASSRSTVRAGTPSFHTCEVNNCLLCGSSDPTPDVLVYLYEGVRFPAARCRSCGFVFLSRQPSREEFGRLYNPAYFESDYHCGCSEHSYFASEADEKRAANAHLARIEKEIHPGALLEVGCAGGFFLHTARSRGWRPVGVEISNDAAEVARKKFGLDVRTGAIDEAGLESAAFDAVFMGDTLEHVPDPIATLREVKRVMRPGGILLIAIPITLNSLSWKLRLPVYRALRRQKALALPPYHLVEFTPATLRRLLRESGFDIRWVRQSKVSPELRNRPGRSLPLHVVRFLLDGSNWFASRMTGMLGDRALALARKPA